MSTASTMMTSTNQGSPKVIAMSTASTLVTMMPICGIMLSSPPVSPIRSAKGTLKSSSSTDTLKAAMALMMSWARR